MPRKLVKYNKIWFLGVCLQKKLTFQLVGRVKRGTLSNVGRHHAIPPWIEGLNKQKDEWQTWSLCLNEDIPLLPLGINTSDSQTFILRPGLARYLGGKESYCQCRRHGLDSWVRKTPWRSKPILAWKIPWTEEPGGLQFTGSQRVGHNLATEQKQQQQTSLQ